MNLRRSVLMGACVCALIVIVGLGQYLSAVSRDADKEAALRRSRRAGSVTKSTAPTQGSPIPEELAVGQRQQSFQNGQPVMPIFNAELSDNYTGVGWRGGGRSISPNMGVPSYNVPTGGFDQPLWASACGITAFLPDAVAASNGGALVEGSLAGTNNVYRNPPHVRKELPTGFWSDLGGIGSPGFNKGTTGPGGHREPFITETVFFNNVGVDIKRQSYSFSYGYNHTNDFILVRHVLTATGKTDVDLDGTIELNSANGDDATVRNFFIVFNYDFDIPTENSPTSNGISENRGGDDKTPTGFFVQIMPRSVPEDLRASGRYNVPPFGPRVYSGLVQMFDEDDPSVFGVDDYVWSAFRENFVPLHPGEASLMVLDGNGTDATWGDLNASAKPTMFGTPSVGLWSSHQWWEADVRGVLNWYLRSASVFMGSYPGDPGQPEDRSPNTATFTGGAAISDASVDISNWTVKPEIPGMTTKWGDPRRPGVIGGGAGPNPDFNNAAGKYDLITLNDLDGVFQGFVPDPTIGSDRKELTSTTGCDRNMIGWGPYNLAVGQSLTVWETDLVGNGIDGGYDVYQRAIDVWMQRKYNAANDTYYWDGSNDRVIPVFDAVTGDYVDNDGDGKNDVQTVNPGRGPDSGALFFPPAPPVLSVFPTNGGTIGLAWLNNAETAIDPGLGTTDFSKYRVYRASGFIDQFPNVSTTPIGFNSTIIPPNMGVKADGSAVQTDVTDPLSPTLRNNSHPYARFIQEGLTLGADYNVGAVFPFITTRVNKFAAPGFSGPYVQIAEFAGGNTSNTNTFDPPQLVRVPNPLDPADRPPEVADDVIETTPNSRQIVDTNNELDATQAIFVSSFPSTFDASQFPNFAGVPVDPRLVGKAGYVFEDRSPLIGFNYWYYVAAVDNESAVQRDWNSPLADPTATGSSERTIEGLETFYTMNANSTDGRWHGTFPYRGLTVGPQVPGQEVVPSTAVRNTVTGGKADFLDKVTVAPNPFVFQAQWDLAVPGQQSVKFFNIPVPSKITIFDVTGVLVDEFDVPSSKTTTIGGVTDWKLTNKSNVPISGGLYIVIIQANINGKNFEKTLKLYVRR